MPKYSFAFSKMYFEAPEFSGYGCSECHASSTNSSHPLNTNLEPVPMQLSVSEVRELNAETNISLDPSHSPASTMGP